MNTRKTVTLGGFAVGAALWAAPLASADDLTSLYDTEVSSLNSIFETEAAVAGDSADVVTGGTGVLDSIPPADAPDTAPLTTLDYELYGPFAGFLDLDAAPGAQDLFNGALVEFDDATNVVAFFLTDNSGDLIPTTDLIGLADQGLDVSGATDASLFGSFLNTGISDLITAFTGGALG